MIYSSKEECYDDILLSLELGIIEESDVRHLLEFYKELEFYECCQGVVDAFVAYTKKKDEHTKTTTGRSS
jgi:hypothetical protein